MNKHTKMHTCAFRKFIDDFHDYCAKKDATYSCDAPEDYPLWEECKACKDYQPRRAEKPLWTPPFSNIGRRGGPTSTVFDANGCFVCSCSCGIGITAEQSKERARRIAEALTRQEGRVGK